jgi:2,3-bisphosphoglycerate-dependent phosphoglycerate mutase
MQLYFIRHGQSTNNAVWDQYDKNGYLEARSTDPDLTEKGLEQAKRVGEYLAMPYQPSEYDPQNRNGFGLTHLYSSLMIRAVKTGLAIAKETVVPLVAMPEVHETNGLFDTVFRDGEVVHVGQPGPGRSYFETNFPELVLPKDLTDEGWWNREKEPREEYLIRAHRVVRQLMEKHAGKDDRVGIVMHGGIFARILTAFFDVQAEKYWFLMNNCAISRVDVDAEGRVILLYMNRVDFLPDDLVT